MQHQKQYKPATKKKSHFIHVLQIINYYWILKYQSHATSNMSKTSSELFKCHPRATTDKFYQSQEIRNIFISKIAILSSPPNHLQYSCFQKNILKALTDYFNLNSVVNTKYSPSIDKGLINKPITFTTTSTNSSDNRFWVYFCIMGGFDLIVWMCFVINIYSQLLLYTVQLTPITKS